jgi:uncharacterized membrane protein YeaQ/YmgE (transglycosylase-associated protein family)
MYIVYFLLIGLAAGFLAGYILQRRGFGLVGNLLVGVLGAIAGGFLFRLVGLATTNMLGQLISAVVGSIAVLALVGLLNKHTR